MRCTVSAAVSGKRGDPAYLWLRLLPKMFAIKGLKYRFANQRAYDCICLACYSLQA
jgi:hypothetical protein